jgi:lycopene cyclase CruA
LSAELGASSLIGLIETNNTLMVEELNTQNHALEPFVPQGKLREGSALKTLAEHYPRTVAAFAEMGALDHLERILRLDAVWDDIRRPPTTDHRPPNGQRAMYGGSSLSAERQRCGQGGADPTWTDLYTQSAICNLQSAIDYDLIYAGGGLGLIHAAVMAQRYRWRVLLFDRGEVGCAHREWNISRAELAQLVAVGFCTWDELTSLIMAEYDCGVVRFHASQGLATELRMRDVLNVALDANALLRLARRKLEDTGGIVLDRRVFRRVVASASGSLCVEVEAACGDGAVERYTGRLLLDGMGSTSPLALRRFAACPEPRLRGRPFSGVCPTVGTVATGFAAGEAPEEHNRRVGEILVSVADAQRGQQYIWEGFPGRGDELTVYLFYYDTLRSQVAGRKSQRWLNMRPATCDLRPAPSLMQLFEDYFELLPTYKRLGSSFRHLKPVYGYIPARHSVRRQEAPLLRGVLPIGDSAAQQSPLTFCGFGSHIRNLPRTTALLDEALRHDLLDPSHLGAINPYQVNVSLNWVFSRFMQPWRAPGDVNTLQNVFLAVLNDLGEDLAQRFFRDQMRWSDYHRMVLGTFRHHPQVALKAWRVLGPSGIRRWIADYLTYSGAALLAAGGRRLGLGGRLALARVGEWLAPSLGLRLRARYAEWRAMGWISEPRTKNQEPRTGEH